MEPALQRRVQRYGWDKAAAYYENFWQQQLKPAQQLMLEMAKLQPGEKVIDIACGTGLVSFPAADAVGKKGFVLGTDISDNMVKSCSELADKKGYSNTQFKRMDAEELTVAGKEFDIVLCALGLMYFPDPVKALKEMYRVLKPGGRVSVAVWGQRSKCGWAEIFEIVDKRVASEVCPMFFNLGNAAMLERSMAAAGFAGITIQRINSVLHYNNDEEACGAAFAGGPVALAYSKFSPEIKKEVHKEYLESIHPFKNGQAYNIPGEFVAGLASRPLSKNNHAGLF